MYCLVSYVISIFIIDLYSFIIFVDDVPSVNNPTPREWLKKRYNTPCMGDRGTKNMTDKNHILSFYFKISEVTLLGVGKGERWGRRVNIDYEGEDRIEHFVCRNSDNYNIDLLKFTLDNVQVIKSQTGKSKEILFNCFKCTSYHKLEIIGKRQLTRTEVAKMYNR